MFYTVVFLLTVGLTLVNGASFWQGLKKPEVCDTKECRKAADQITKWMNTAYKPCDDFYEYSCGCWTSPENKTGNQKINMSLGSRDDFVTVHLKNFLLDDTLDRESKLFYMLRRFMTMCLDEESISARGTFPAVQLFREVGGWPVLEKDWSEENWDFLKVEKLFGVFFKIDLLPLPPDYVWTLAIHPQFSTSPSIEELSEGFQTESVQAYYNKMCFLAESFGANRNAAEKELTESLNFEIALAEFAVDMNDSDDYELTNLSELQSNFSWIDWNKLLSSSILESVTLSKNESIILVNPDYMRQLVSMISEYPKRTIANYMMTNAARTITKYLSPKVFNITSDGEEFRFKMCVELLEGSSLLGVFASYIARQTVEDTKAATEMTQNILNELLIELEELEWIDEKTRSTAITSLKNTELLIAFPDELLNWDIVEELYKEVKINTSYFFEAAIDSDEWVNKDSLRNLGKSAKDMTLRDQIKNAMSINAYYRISANHIVVSAAFLHFIPLFSHKVPAYVNYGNAGGIIAHELTHALDFQSDKSNDTDNHMGDMTLNQAMFRWGDNATEEKYDEKKQCIIDQYSSFNDTKYTGLQLNGEQTQREDVADIGGFKLALNAYRRYAAQLPSPEPKLPTLEHYSIEQLFILSLSNAYCEIPNKWVLLAQLAHDTHSPFEFRVKGMMMNSPDFSNIFSCKSNDPMNPEKKCEVW